MPVPERPRLTMDVPPLPPRAPDTHKGQAGKVAIIAGSRGMSGAAVLCGLGALRGGAGLVRVYCAESIQPIVASSEPCLMTVPLPEQKDGTIGEAAAREAAPSLAWANVVAIGPGLRDAHGPAQFVAQMRSSWRGPTVYDADALNTLSVCPTIRDWWKRHANTPTIITPHPGEMARLRKGTGLPEISGSDDGTRVRSAYEYAALSGVTVVLKGYRTVVSTPDAAYINTTGNAGMATGGMGDVLTGLIAALMAQGLPPFDAARLGVYVHGLAADHCKKEIAPVGYLARDVADAIPAALAAASHQRMGFK